MKNCFLLKFIAVLLCAASLMGVLGGTAGALILADGDLYHKSVDEAVAQRIQALVSESATQLANRYGDQVLGGCPSDISRYPHGNPMDWNFISYGYASS